MATSGWYYDRDFIYPAFWESSHGYRRRMPIIVLACAAISCKCEKCCLGCGPVVHVSWYRKIETISFCVCQKAWRMRWAAACRHPPARRTLPTHPPAPTPAPQTPATAKQVRHHTPYNTTLSSKQYQLYHSVNVNYYSTSSIVRYVQ